MQFFDLLGTNLMLLIFAAFFVLLSLGLGFVRTEAIKAKQIADYYTQKTIPLLIQHEILYHLSLGLLKRHPDEIQTLKHELRVRLSDAHSNMSIEKFDSRHIIYIKQLTYFLNTFFNQLDEYEIRHESPKEDCECLRCKIARELAIVLKETDEFRPCQFCRTPTLGWAEQKLMLDKLDVEIKERLAGTIIPCCNTCQDNELTNTRETEWVKHAGSSITLEVLERVGGADTD